MGEVIALKIRSQPNRTKRVSVPMHVIDRLNSELPDGIHPCLGPIQVDVDASKSGGIRFGFPNGAVLSFTVFVQQFVGEFMGQHPE